MSVISDFTAATSVKIMRIDGVLHIPFQMDRALSRENVCPTKRASESTITIRASEFLDIEEGDFDIVFDQLDVLEAGETRVLAQFRSNQTFDQPLQVRGAPRVQLRTVSGEITVEMRSVAVRDEDDCAGAPRSYAITVATPATPSFLNELRVGVSLGALALEIVDDGITLDAVAGGERPPVPEPLRLTNVLLAVRRSCETPAPARVTGSVVMNRRVVRSDGTVRVTLTATAGRTVTVIPAQVPVSSGSSRATFQVPVPAAYIGRVTVTAVFGADRQEAEIEVVDDTDVFCLAPEMYFLIRNFHLLIFPCPELYINDIGELLGVREGFGFRQLGDGSSISFRERVGGEVRRAAMNAFGEVAGSSIDAQGKLHGFVMVAGESTAAVILNDVQLTAINDDGLAVGYRRIKDENAAFAFALTRAKTPTARAKGKAVPLALPKASRSEAVAVNNLGQIVVVATLGSPKILLFEKIGKETKETEMGDISERGTVRKLTDSGYLLGNDFAKGEGHRPFLISNQGKRMEVAVLKGFDHAIAYDVDERGTVLGRAFTNKEGASRAFRFTMSRGTEDLNDLVKLEKGGTITAALSANRRGEIVVEIAHGDDIGYAVIAPK